MFPKAKKDKGEIPKNMVVVYKKKSSGVSE